MGKKARESYAIPVPVKVGEELDLTVLRTGVGGEGVARFEGFTIFVDGVLPGEMARVRIEEVLDRFAKAKPLQLLTQAPARAIPACSAFGVCGGCQVQHMAYPAELEWKRQLVVDALARIGHFDAEKMDRLVETVRAMENPWRYRNKVSLLAAPKGEGFVAGFVEEGTHDPVTQAECLLRPALHDELISAILAVLARYQVTAFDEATGNGEIRQILVRSTKNGDAMVVLAAALKLARGQEIAKAIAAVPLAEGRVASVVELVIPFSRNRRRLSKLQERILWGKPELEESMMELDFLVSAQSFLQVNPAQTEVLYRTAMAMAHLSGKETVLDLYAGIGTLSLVAARHAKQVYGVESVPAAVEDAYRNRDLNGIANAEFYLGRAEEVLPDLVKQGLAADVVMLDPPRLGCKPEVIEAMAATGAGRIVYVSCNPATLARDLARLAERGYQVERVVPVDMFPQTVHVETVVLIERKCIPTK